MCILCKHKFAQNMRILSSYINKSKSNLTFGRGSGSSCSYFHVVYVNEDVNKSKQLF